MEEASVLNGLIDFLLSKQPNSRLHLDRSNY